MFPARAPMWVLATALAIVLLVVSARPLLGGGAWIAGQRPAESTPIHPRARTTVLPVTAA